MSYIDINFTGAVTTSETWQISYIYQAEASVGVTETFVTTRISNFQVTNTTDLNLLANNLLTALNIDLPTQADGDKLTLTFLVGANPGVRITGTDFQFTQIAAPSNSTTNVVNDTPWAPSFSLDSVAFSQAGSNPCTTIRATVTESDGTSPFEWITPNAGQSGLISDIPRSGGLTTITIQDDNLDEASIQILVPDELTTANIIQPLSIVTNPSGLDATLTVFLQDLDPLLTVEFSLDGITFQSSNIFSSVVDGSYTLYVSDQYGCIVTLPFTVDVATSIELPPAYYYISPSNSFRFIESQAAINGSTIQYKYDNVLNNDYTLVRFNNPSYCQPWGISDIVPTQLRTNYDSVSPRLIDSEGNITVLTEVKQSSNLGLNETGSLIIYDLGDSQTGVYFSDGNLKEWSKVGQNFTLGGTASDGTFQIKQIIYDSDVSAQVMIIDRLYTDGSPNVSGTYDVTYDRLNYEVWGFDTDLNVTEGIYTVQILLTDSDYDSVTWNSEPIRVTSDYTDLVYLEWSLNPEDGIDYDTGIIHKQRFNGLALRQNFGLNSTVYTDSKRKLTKLDGNVIRSWKVDAINLPDWVYEKLQIACSMQLINLNGETVQTDEGFGEAEEAQQYQRRLVASCVFQVVDYNQSFTDTFDINADSYLEIDTGLLEIDI